MEVFPAYLKKEEQVTLLWFFPGTYLRCSLVLMKVLDTCINQNLHLEQHIGCWNISISNSINSVPKKLNGHHV